MLRQLAPSYGWFLVGVVLGVRAVTHLWIDPSGISLATLLGALAALILAVHNTPLPPPG